MELTIPRIFDAHVHFRTGSMLRRVLPHTVRVTAYATVMPNTHPRAILTADDVL